MGWAAEDGLLEGPRRSRVVRGWGVLARGGRQIAEDAMPVIYIEIEGML